jgi:plastocyanin
MLAIGLGTLAFGVPGLGCGSDDSMGESSEPQRPPGTVEAIDFAFEPVDVEIEAGEAVTWENTGDTIHNVEGEDFFSEAIDPGKSYKRTFREPGTYEYICNLHPTQMKGTVKVTEG